MPTENSRVLGIEGGGTKTDWVLLENSRVRNSGSLPASNLRLIGDEALKGIFEVLPHDATHVGAFLAGCATEADRARLTALAKSVWPDAQRVVGSDRDSGFAAAFENRDGIVVIGGTGSAVTGRKGGVIERAGGWGQLLGDRGGGYNLALEGLRQVLECYDLTGRVTALGKSVLRALSLTRLQELVSWVSEADKMSVAKLAPVIFEAAKSGDQEMTSVIQCGAKLLAEFACAVSERLEFPAPEVRLMGGLFAHHPEYADLFKDYFCDMKPGAQVELCTRSGALGAAWLASHAAGQTEPRPSQRETANLTELAAAATEQRNPRSARLDELSTEELVDLFISEESYVAEALAAAREAIQKAVDLASEALRHGGRLFYIGAGTSGRLGVLDASEIPPTFGASPELVQGIIAGGARALFQAVEGAEDQREQGAHAIFERGVTDRDVVCGIAASGRTPYVLGALDRARKTGAKTILLTCNPARTKSDAWDAEIDLPTGPEIVTGSTRLKAGTATKLVLNMLSTCAMIRLGKVRGNLMIDLNISNVKLRDRAIRLVSQIRACSYEEAQKSLLAHAWNIRESLDDDTRKI